MYLVMVFFGAVIGYFISRLLVKRDKSIGILRVETSDPDGPFLFLEISENPRSLKHGQHVVMTVDTRSYISHE